MLLRRAAAASAALVLMLAAHPLIAQSSNSVLLGAGLSVPAGDLAVYANNGWDITAGLEHRFGRGPVGVRLDFSYAVNSDTTGLGFHESTALITGMANIVYHFQGSRPHLYALLGVGYFGRRFSTDDPDDEAINDSRFAFQVGEGLTFRVGSATLFIEGRFVSGTGEDPLRFFPVVIGVRFGGPKQ